MGLRADIAILRHLLFTRATGTTHRDRLDAFYRGQAANYDAFRQRLLQGRERLVEQLPLNPGAVWVDLGGGTGANIAMAGSRVQRLKQAIVVDLCPSLISIARERAESAGWKNVSVVEADATRFTPECPADVVTFSYALTMIPNWYEAVQQALSILRPGGVLAVVDFYVARKYPDVGRARHPWLHRSFWPLWFAADNVWLSPDHLPYLHRHTERLNCEEALARVPYFPLLRVPYYIYLGRKQG